MRPIVLHALCCLCGSVRPQVVTGKSTGGARSHAHTVPSSVAGTGRNVHSSYDFKASAWRQWRRCEFHSIGPIDQVLFTLLGGKVDQLGNRCTKWEAASCSCSAPLDLLGTDHTVVEIGANDGLHMSNSRFFEMQLGWRSLCVEANPQVYKRLQTNRPNCINVNALVGQRSDFNGSSSVPYISFYRREGNEKKNTARDWETGLSGIESASATNKEISSFRRAQGFAKRNIGLQVQRDLLPVVPFSQLFARHGIDKIDVSVYAPHMHCTCTAHVPRMHSSSSTAHLHLR